jgi:hypothetical protein
MNFKIFKSPELPRASLAAVVAMLLGQFCAYLLGGYSLSVRALAAGVGACAGIWLVHKLWCARRPK